MRYKSKGFLALFTGALLIVSVPNSSRAQSKSMATEELARRADVIVVGKVTAVQSEWNADRSRIYTTVTVAIDQNIKGQGNPISVTISTPGGEIGGVGEWYSHTPKFKVDEEVVVFAEREKGGRLIVSGGDQGKLTVMNEESTGSKTVIDSEPLMMYTSRLKSVVQAQSRE
ncbi:MAG TPA: hypothetical protein VGB89_08870 [Bacteroidota bacterium]|jgi:hypothetical protein